MKNHIKLGIAVMIVSIMSFSAWFAYNKYVANKEKEVTVQYIVGEDGSPEVTYIENNVSPRKLLRIVNEIESMKFLDFSNLWQVYTVKVKIG